jgi:hypothetical protein
MVLLLAVAAALLSSHCPLATSTSSIQKNPIVSAVQQVLPLDALQPGSFLFLFSYPFSIHSVPC